MVILHLLLLFGLVAFTLLMILLLTNLPGGIVRNQTKRLLRKIDGISIVITFKNEAANLKKLLDSLSIQSYNGIFEIILVNDESTDFYEETLTPYLGDENRLRLIDSVFDHTVNLTSRQQALDAGVQAARFNTIACTDADIVLKNDWLYSLVTMLKSGNDFVFGHTLVESGNLNFFQRVEQWQLEFLMNTAAAFSKAALPLSCMGNNLAFRKDGYVAIGGQAGVGYSIVEDRDLFIHFKKEGYACSAVSPFKITAYTSASSSVGSWLNQMARWTVGGLSSGGALLAISMLFAFQNIVLLLSMVGLMIAPVTILAVINAVLVLIFTVVGFKRIYSPLSGWLYPLFFFVQIIETVMVFGMIIFVRRITWKGNTLQSRSVTNAL